MFHQLDRKYPKFRHILLDKFVGRVNPSLISILALISAIISGIFFFYGRFIFGGIFVLLNGFFDILDGEIAKREKKQTKIGDFIDHTLDRVSDIFIFGGISMSGYVPQYLGFLALISILFVSYLGTQAQALLDKRYYGGILGRADRLFILSLFSILTPYLKIIMYYGIWIIFILSIITAIQRIKFIYDNLS
ncbi:MAG: CDP-alcohol phosphatidyltransferase family protein [Candidatus Aenigmarchaeota archaeon]|nr:CDP-alcohol phosphatidyltransferase family protein [Candidatus Aenigmarchaeota archaeon]